MAIRFCVGPHFLTLFPLDRPLSLPILSSYCCTCMTFKSQTLTFPNSSTADVQGALKIRSPEESRPTAQIPRLNQPVRAYRAAPEDRHFRHPLGSFFP